MSGIFFQYSIQVCVEQLFDILQKWTVIDSKACLTLTILVYIW